MENRTFVITVIVVAVLSLMFGVWVTDAFHGKVRYQFSVAQNGKTLFIWNTRVGYKVTHYDDASKTLFSVAELED